MLQFLRKIRRSLIQSGRVGNYSSPVSKYLLYAIGEIALVVIGILIALQINNWNEQKKTNQFEQQLLISLKNSMVGDLRSQERSIRWNEEMQSSCAIILKHINEKLPYDDSLHYYFAHATSYTSFSVSDSEYKNIESYGLHIFKNKETRYHLTRLHERHVPLLNLMLEQENQYYYQIAVPVYTKLFESTSKGGFDVEREMIPYDYNLLMQNKKYKNILTTNLKNRRREHYQMNNILNILKEVIDLLEKEIQMR